MSVYNLTFFQDKLSKAAGEKKSNQHFIIQQKIFSQISKLYIYFKTTGMVQKGKIYLHISVFFPFMTLCKQNLEKIIYWWYFTTKEMQNPQKYIF